MFKKAVIFPIFVTSWLILMVHAIIPHHHHDKEEVNISNNCHSHCHNHNNDNSNNLWHSITSNHDHKESVCHFSVEILTQISLDQTFIPASANYNISVVAEDLKIKWLDPVYIIKPLYLHNSQLRAPPIG